MAWPQGTSVKFEDVFKTPEQVAQHKTGLKILLWGKEDTMKTGAGLSFPPPVFHLDTELGAPPLFQYFPGKEIQWCDATYLNPDTDMPDPFVAFSRLESTIGMVKKFVDETMKKKQDEIAQRITEGSLRTEAIKELMQKPYGTIVIDSGTDVWDWIQAWIQGVGKKKDGQLLQFEWAKAKQRWRQLILRLMAKPMHFVMTAQPQEIYAKIGNRAEATGTFRPRIQGASPHVFDIVVRMMKWETRDPKTQQVSVKYMSEVTKCRFKKGWRKQFEDLTYQKLIDALKAELGVEVW